MIVLLLELLAGPSAQAAFDPPVDTVGPVTLRLETPATAYFGSSARGDAFSVTATVESAAASILPGTLEVQGIDGWTVSPAGAIPVRLTGGALGRYVFTINPTLPLGHHDIYNYPLRGHLAIHYGSQAFKANAVSVVRACRGCGGYPSLFTLSLHEGWWGGVQIANLTILDSIPGHLAVAPTSTAPPTKHPRPERILGSLKTGREVWRVTLSPGDHGLFDVTIGLRKNDVRLSFSGWRIRLMDQRLDPEFNSGYVVEDSHEEEEAGPNTWRVRHHLKTVSGPMDLIGEVRIDGPGLRASFHLENIPTDKPWHEIRLQDVECGPWNQDATRMYAGEGWVLDRPGAFELSYDGHRLATSYVGLEFGPGAAMVMGVDVPPDKLVVDPVTHTYALHAPLDQTQTFIPCRTVWEGVKAWRALDKRPAAAGVPKLAGRFTFDLWDGTFAKGAAALTQAFRYGLTDAVVIWHNWQRFGYDYRLPDIWPPNPAKGTPAEFAALAKACADHGALFAPHDNLIDFYPDAEGFSYSKVAFTRDGEPVKAWLNRWHADAQSYRWLPTAIRPVLERNLPLIKAGINPTAYFLDVWSSLGPYDAYTSDGAFVSRVETRKIWADSLNWIRDQLGGAPTISESGHDALIGSLDGAQTNHLRIGKPPAGEGSWFVVDLPCADAERVPWFDAAYHDRFVGLGAGYPDRYAAGLDLKDHGAFSDDYLSTEMLDGHPAMVDRPMGPDVVRVYWLTHDVLKALALAKLDRVEFGGGNLHRPHVKWEGGGEVWVNRGTTDWKIVDHVLPPFGFYAKVPVGDRAATAAVERHGADVVEWAKSPEAVYVNPRAAKSVTVGGITAGEAIRLTKRDGRLLAMPLPESTGGSLRLRWQSLPWDLKGPSTVSSLDPAGAVLSSTPLRRLGDAVLLSLSPSVFAYRLE